MIVTTVDHLYPNYKSIQVCTHCTMSVTSACSRSLPEPEVHVHDFMHLLQLGQTLDCLGEDPGVVCLKEQPLTVDGSPITVTPGKL